MQPTSVKENIVMTQLPKNIRQVGEPNTGYRIYMEDYVHTFVKKAQELAGNEMCVGILLGIITKIDSEDCMFINGALLIDNIKKEEKENGENREFQFTASVWKKIYEDIRAYFPQLMMQGWFVAGKEDVSIDMISLERIHKNAFSKEESVLYLCHGEETSIWRNSGSYFSQMQGFYIYYEKNDAMQEYMIEIGQSAPSEKITKDETVQNFREIMERRKEERRLTKTVLRGVGMVSAAAVLFLAVSAWRDNRMIVSNGDNSSGSDIHYETNINDIETSEYIVQVGADVTEEEESFLTEESESEVNETQSQEPSSEDVQAGITVNYYEIQKGDTLVGISMSFYGTLSMVEEICRVNQIENPNAIYTGQKIRLP